MVGTVIEYLAPLTLADRPLYVASWVTEVRAASFTLAYELFTEPADAEHPSSTRARRPCSRRTTSARSGPRRLTADERERLLRDPEPSPFADQGRAPAPGTLGRRRLARGRARAVLRRRPPRPRQQRPLPRLRAGGDDEPAGRLLPRGRASTATCDLVVARTEIDYLGQMNLRPEPYDVWARVTDVGTTSVAFEAEIRDGDRVMARCRTVEVSLDEDDRPRPLIPEHRRGVRAATTSPGSGTDDARRASAAGAARGAGRPGRRSPSCRARRPSRPRRGRPRRCRRPPDARAREGVRAARRPSCRSRARCPPRAPATGC